MDTSNTQLLQTIELSVKDFCYKNGIDYTGVSCVEGSEEIVLSIANANPDQIKAIKAHLKELEKNGK